MKVIAIVQAELDCEDMKWQEIIELYKKFPGDFVEAIMLVDKAKLVLRNPGTGEEVVVSEE